MRLTNDCYLISLRASRVEYYFRDDRGWVKQSTTGRRFKATAEQVLNHLLPALAGVNTKVSVRVQHRDLDPGAGTLLDELRAFETATEPDKA
ncbi:MAG TPA: hypothetical protein VF956_00445 [Candidatus Dormibacteraeota bacterium]